MLKSPRPPAPKRPLGGYLIALATGQHQLVGYTKDRPRELLTVNDEIRDHIQSRTNATEIRDQAVKAGMRLLREDGLLKIAAGMTTPAEVQRVTVRATM